MKSRNNINHILVIDDDEFLLHTIRKKLELAHYRVTISSNVHDAFFKISMSKPDLILLDVIMPELNGVEFMHLINSHDLSGHVPIILMSLLPKQELSKMGYNLGSSYYLDKPFDVNKLPYIIKSANFNA